MMRNRYTMSLVGRKRVSHHHPTLPLCSYPGIRMLDQPYMTDLIEANSMGHEPNLIDIYSASWGPTDDGETVDGPRNATMRAIVRGVNEVSDDGPMVAVGLRQGRMGW